MGATVGSAVGATVGANKREHFSLRQNKTRSSFFVLTFSPTLLVWPSSKRFFTFLAKWAMHIFSQQLDGLSLQELRSRSDAINKKLLVQEAEEVQRDGIQKTHMVSVDHTDDYGGELISNIDHLGATSVFAHT